MEGLLLLALSILTGAGCQDWGVTLPVDPLAGWSGSCVTIPCSYTYPEGQLVRAMTWSQNKERIVRLTAAAGQGYGKAERVQFLGDLQHNCTLRLNPLALGDGGAYSFEFQTQSQTWRSPRALCLTVSVVNYGITRTGGASSGLYWYDRAGARILEETAAGQRESRLSMHIVWQHRGAALECRVWGYQNRCLPKGSQPPATGPAVWGTAGLDQFYFWVHNYEDLPRGPSLQFEQGTTLSYGGNYTCTEWVSGTRLGYLAISPTTYVAILGAPPPMVHVVATSGPYHSTGEPLSLMCWLDTSAYGGVKEYQCEPLSPRPECSQSQSTPNPSTGRHGVAPASAPPALALTSTDPSLPAPASQPRKSVKGTGGGAWVGPRLTVWGDSIDWYQLSPGPMAGFGAGVPLLFLLSNLRV
ncbi:unnamed protein product [Natator depressus]